MIIGERLRALREVKKFSQGDMEKKTGLLRHYISRVENGHMVPAIETLEKFARALEVPMYQLFYEGEETPKLPNLLKRKTTEDILWDSSGKDENMLRHRSRWHRIIVARHPLSTRQWAATGLDSKVTGTEAEIRRLRRLGPHSDKTVSRDLAKNEYHMPNSPRRSRTQSVIIGGAF